MVDVRINCEWIVEPEGSCYLITSPDAPGFVLGADDANHATERVPKMLRAFLGDETAEPIYRFTGPRPPAAASPPPPTSPSP